MAVNVCVSAYMCICVCKNFHSKTVLPNSSYMNFLRKKKMKTNFGSLGI